MRIITIRIRGGKAQGKTFSAEKIMEVLKNDFFVIHLRGPNGLKPSKEDRRESIQMALAEGHENIALIYESQRAAI